MGSDITDKTLGIDPPQMPEINVDIPKIPKPKKTPPVPTVQSNEVQMATDQSLARRRRARSRLSSSSQVPGNAPRTAQPGLTPILG